MVSHSRLEIVLPMNGGVYKTVTMLGEWFACLHIDFFTARLSCILTKSILLKKKKSILLVCTNFEIMTDSEILKTINIK